MKLLLLAALLVTALAVGLYLAGDTLRPSPPGGDFTLQSEDGPVALQDYQGQWVILYFGFASCPDVCPTSLMRWANAFDALSEQQQERVVLLFITLDPERDSPEFMAEYVRHFHPDFVGLSGGRGVIDEVAERYGVIHEQVEVDSLMDYTINHSSYSYLVNPHGELVDMLTDDSDAATREQALRSALQSSVR